jgi:hypothetical protein
VGIAWLDTRDAPQRDAYHLYFTASLDGGETFLRPVRASSVVSIPASGGNLRPWQMGASHRPDDDSISTVLTLTSAYSRFPGGGDYAGMVADARGIFHPAWPDSRSGTFQIYTSSIEVRAIDAQHREVAKSMRPIDLRGRVLMEALQSEIDAKTHIVTTPIRLRNISKDTLYPPLTVTVKGLTTPEMVIVYGPKVGGGEILNATNGKHGAGAVFDYTAMLGGSGVLAPGATSDVILWRYRMPDHEQAKGIDMAFSAAIRGSIRGH